MGKTVYFKNENTKLVDARVACEQALDLDSGQRNFGSARAGFSLRSPTLSYSLARFARRKLLLFRSHAAKIALPRSQEPARRLMPEKLLLCVVSLVACSRHVYLS